MKTEQSLNDSPDKRLNEVQDPTGENHQVSQRRHQDAGINSEHNQDTELISINLIYDYPVRWSQFKVLRDFIQNFYDAVGWAQWDEQFSYELADNLLVLNARNVGFSYDWLLHIGASTKRGNVGNYAGHFGEGFKIAALCAVRDYQWTIEVYSRDWELTVVTTPLVVDGQTLKSLAYRVRRLSTPRQDTILKLSPFQDENLLQNALLSFYYPSNALLGQSIWESSDCAVYLRSKEQKPNGYPVTYDNSGQGIIFAGYQALGSFEYPLVFCLHKYNHDDRERNTLYRMNVVKIIHDIAYKLPPEASAQVLQILKNRWYDRPRKKYDFESWHEIIGALVRNIARSPQQTSTWKELNPNLLVANQVKRTDLPRYNRRRQALDWLKQSTTSFRLVQSAFLKLGYPLLEDLCEKDDGFSVTREPDPLEKDRITMLERFILSLLPDLFTNLEIPPCKLIKSERAAWQGMAICVPLTTPSGHFRGIPIRYRLPYVALKPSLLQSRNFGNALSTYLHELAHMFGGDRSAAFSHALSELMEITLSQARLIADWQEEWEEKD